jgi:ABC-type glycerol-3-phosphate transport system substrate-binding protein
MVVPKGAKRIEGAIRFIAYACSEQGQRRYLPGTTNLPTTKSLLEDQSLFPDQMEFFRGILPIAKGLPPGLPVNAVYWDNQAVVMSEIVYDGVEVMASLRKCEQQTQAELNQYLPLR